MVADTTSNHGKAAAGPSHTGYYLARSKKREPADVHLGDRSIPRLASGRDSSGSATVRIPGGTAPGAYRIIACADDRSQVKETSERDNCRAAAAPLHVILPPDTTPPSFGGIESATVTQTAVTLSWSAGSDNRTPPNRLVYEVFMASSPGAESYHAPTVTSSPGATSVKVSGLSPGTSYYFVARARDEAGNLSTSKLERAAATDPDTTPPVFAGLQTATDQGTGCGISDPNATCHAHLTWNPASDDFTPQSAIVYDIYVSSTPGHENFTAPPKYTSAPGATSFDTPVEQDLLSCFVVRARDSAGNRDSNTVEHCPQPAP